MFSGCFHFINFAISDTYTSHFQAKFSFSRLVNLNSDMSLHVHYNVQSVYVSEELILNVQLQGLFVLFHLDEE